VHHRKRAGRVSTYSRSQVSKAEVGGLLRSLCVRTRFGGSRSRHTLVPGITLACYLGSQLWHDSHERPAEERDDNHGHPRRHLGEAPCSISVGDGQAVLLERTVEGVKDALIRFNLLDLVVDDKLLERLGGGSRLVQRLVANGGDGRRLVSHGLGDLEVVQRRRADGPRVAEDVLGFAVEVGELGRIWLRSEDRERCLFVLSIDIRSI
jgi:hypothetical protein